MSGHIIHLDICKTCKRILWLGLNVYSLRNLIRLSQWDLKCHLHNGEDYKCKRIYSNNKTRYKLEDLTELWYED